MFYGSSGYLSDSGAASSAFYGKAEDDGFGGSIFNGDGLKDLIVGAYLNDCAGSGSD